MEIFIPGWMKIAMIWKIWTQVEISFEKTESLEGKWNK